MRYHVGTVKELWRYPVKSMEGELLKAAEIDSTGLVGDRYWAIRDEVNNETGIVRKLPKLLQCTARYQDEPSAGQTGPEIPQVTVTLPDGISLSSNDEDAGQILSDFLGKEVSIKPLQPRSDWKFYRLNVMNGEKSLKKQFGAKDVLPELGAISWLKILELAFFVTPVGHYYDMYPLHVVSSNSMEKLRSLESEGDFQTKRFRPNIYIESVSKNANLDEFDWLGGNLHIGNTVIKCESRTVRCSMPAQPQKGLKKDSKVLRTLEKYTDRHLGINASVLKAGTINHGDPVYWEPESKYALRKLYQPISDKIKSSAVLALLRGIDRLGK